MSTILIVEDDAALSKGLVYALEKEGFRTITADTVQEALRQWGENSVDLALLDMSLPDGSGFDLCSRIRSSSSIPIVFLTARDEEVNVVMGLDIGADDYVTKPFRLKELVSRIRAVLRRRQTNLDTMPGIVRSGDICLFLAEQRATKAGQELALTPTEYRLLVLFMQNPLKVLSRSRILERLWDVDDKYIDGNTLAVHIRRLREKIENDASMPEYIVTVRTLGYKWNQGGDTIL